MTVPDVTRAVVAIETIDRAQRRVANERHRAARAGDVAARHEALSTAGPDWLRQFHAEIAVAQRQMEARHLVSAGIHASHVERLRKWATAAGRQVTDASAEGRAEALQRDVRDLRPYQDSLTGLPSRELFIDRLGDTVGWLDDFSRHAQKARRRFGVCQVGVDNFKALNDRFGHRVGEQLLVSVGNRLARALPDHLVARLAGDEFGILVEDTGGATDLAAVAESALAAIGEPVRINGHHLRVSASAGVVERPVAGADPIEVMRAAEMSLTWARQEGGGHWALYEQARGDQTMARAALAADLPEAIEHDQLFLEYQPIVRLRDGAIAGAEALVRWRHPQLGVLYPGSFIELAEASDVILRLGRVVLDQACHQAARWSTATRTAPFVSVNVAARQLGDASLVSDVTTAVQRARLPASRLQLEITESGLVSSDKAPISTLRALANMGIGIAIDDFGTGYSNLGYLRRLPVTCLKIDHSFVADVGPPVDEATPDRAVQLLGAMASLGHMLNMSVTVEGVATREQAESVRLLGFDLAQGWYFGKPVDADRFAALVAAPDG